MTVTVLIKKPPVPTKRATVILNKVQSCSALLRVVVVFIGSCRKSVLRYIFLILDARRLDALYLREQGCEDPWLFFETKRGQLAKTFVKKCRKWCKEVETFTREIKAELQHGVIMRQCPCLWDVRRFSGWVVPAQWPARSAYWSSVPLLVRHCDVLSRLVKAKPPFAPRRSFEVVLRWDRCIGGIMWVIPGTSTAMLWPRVEAFVLNVFCTLLLHECDTWLMVTRSHGRDQTNRLLSNQEKLVLSDFVICHISVA